ncbi:hypothetical protein BKA93DRAFT_752454 [Sparassis latifolia]
MSKKMEMDVQYTPESPAKKRKVSRDSEEGIADAGPSEVQTAEPDIVMHEGSPKQPAATTGQVKNGVSRVLAEWTPCLRDRLADLLSTEAHPNIPDHPESAFTMALLKEWHMHALMSKKGAYNYMYAIRCLTNNSALHTVKLNLAIYHLPNHDPQSLTVPCFTRPWPGMNMPQDWRQTPAALA